MASYPMSGLGRVVRRSPYVPQMSSPSQGYDAPPMYDAPAQRARASAPLLSPQTIAYADASQNDERQRLLGAENRGTSPRGMSPQSEASQRGKIASGATPMIGTSARPSLAPGERNPYTGMSSADAHANNQNFHSNSASMTLTDQQARAMYKTAMAANPGNLAAGEQQFHDTVAKYGVNGRTLLNEHWSQHPQTDYFRGFSESAPQPIKDRPYASGAQTGKTVDGRAVMVEANGQQVGGTMMQQSPIPPKLTPIIGPKPGYTPLTGSALLSPAMPHEQRYVPGAVETPNQITRGEELTKTQNAQMRSMYNIRDAHQAPPGMAPSFTSDSSSTPQYSMADPDQLPQAASRSVPNLADEAIQAPVRMAQAHEQGLMDQTRAKTQGAMDVANVNNASQERRTQTMAAATTQRAGIDAQGKVDTAKARPAGGGANGTVTPQVLQATLGHFAQATVPDGKGGIRYATPEEATAMAYAFHGMSPPKKPSTQPSEPTTQPSAPVTQPTAAQPPPISTFGAQPQQAAAQSTQGGMISAVSPEGVPGQIPADKWAEAEKRGFKRAG